jgi:hypothetical protein
LLHFFARLALAVAFDVDTWLLYVSSSISLAMRLISVALVTNVEIKIIIKSMIM